ncbi:MAG: T9SS type A sorting domain-containing protein, partial [Bacteroidales bacterium]|nr:T9SS type A sorting domain-containing protein [Bacteroidales bacterium]
TGIPGSGLLIYLIDSRFTGNASYDNVSTFDEVYLFRPGGNATTNGNYNTAHFGNHVSRNSFNPNTDPAPFLTQGILDLLDISEIAIQGDSLVFTYNNNPQLLVSADYVILSSQGGSYADFNIASNVFWQIGGGHQGWLDWSPISGNGSESVRVMATSSNLDGNSRMDTLVISSPGMPDKLVRIFQNDFTFIVSDTLINFSKEGGSHELEIISDAYWRIFSLPSWISASPNHGQSTAASILTASSYNGTDSRSARFYVYCSDHIIYVTAVQQGTNSIHDYTVSSLSVYPNPMGNTLHIKQNNPVANIQKAEIFNLTGKMLLSETCDNTSATLSVSHLPQGVYILQIIFENGEREKIKIVK